MSELIDFLIDIGKLKKMKRRGWVLRGVKNPETIAEHSFRVAIMAWFLGTKEKNLNLEKIIKMALIHDICEVYAGDITPYDSIIPKNKKALKKLMETWPRLSSFKKQELFFEKHKNEWQSIVKLISRLEPKLRKEIIDLWLDYEEGLTKEGRFLHQTDRMENLLQALEYWEKDKKFPIRAWWVWAREFFSDPLLLEFMDILDKKFHTKKKKLNV